MVLQRPGFAEAADAQLVLHRRQVLVKPDLIGRPIRVSATGFAKVAVSDDPARPVQPKHRRNLQAVAEPRERTRGDGALRR